MRDTLRTLRERLTPIYGRGEANAIIELIFLHLKGWGRTDMMVNEDKELSPYIKGEVDKILRRLENHEPIQYITGTARFHGLDLHVEPGVLIPRPETSELVDIIADANPGSDLRVLDACTGSGCIAVALARTLKFPDITAIDISEKAMTVASENISRLKVKVNLIEGDIFTWQPAPDSFDIIVSNPPYVDEKERAGMDRNVLDHEPENAIFVPDSDPLKFYRRLLEMGRTALVAGGRIYFEINPLHADEMRDLAHNLGYSDIDIIRDSFGKLRFMTATRP